MTVMMRKDWTSQEEWTDGEQTQDMANTTINTIMSGSGTRSRH